MPSRKVILGNKTMSNECLSSTTFEINIDENSNSISINEDSNRELNYNSYPKSVTADDQPETYRRRKIVKFKVSHRIRLKRYGSFYFRRQNLIE